jgi:anti-anti-sigma factor
MVEGENMEIKVSTQNGRVPITILHVDGDLDSATTDSFEKKANDVIKGGARYILVDLAHSPYVSSRGLRAIHHIFKELNAIHPDATLNEKDIRKGIFANTYKSPYLKVTNLSNESKAVFKTTGFDLYIESFDDIKKAIASF